MFIWLKTKHVKYIYTILIVPIFYVPFTFEVVSMLRSECGMQLVEAG